MSVSIVWLDQDIAKIYHFSEDRMERDLVHLEAGWKESYDALAEHLTNSKQILILSPGAIGEELTQRFATRFPEISRRIVGCETLHKPDDAAVAEYAIKYFRKPLLRSV